MNRGEKRDPSSQRLFSCPGNRFVLISKSGRVVAFRMDANGAPEVMERLEDMDFKATGGMLIQSGWRCVGPGLEYAALLNAP